MKTYQIKKIVDGASVHLKGKFVAVPDHDYDKNIQYDDGNPFKVVFKGEEQIFDSFKEAKTYRTFGDRLKRGTYRLGYFEWKGGE